MTCDKAKVYVSALYDGETVPLAAAEHTAHCADCQELLEGYAQLGAQLRIYGSLLLATPVPDRTWLTTQRNTTMWWQKGFETMRIPRIAFACLVLVLIVLGSRLALVEVRAHEDGSVLMLKLTPAQGGDSLSCNISASGTDHNSCGGLAQIDQSNLFFAVKALKRDGSRVLLSIRSKVTPIGPAGFGPDTAATLPETQSWFTPGETLSVPNTGDLKLTLTGEWADHIPALGGNHDPGPNEIRLVSPLLLKNNTVVGDMAKSSAGADQPGDGVLLFIPGEGRFLLSPMPVAGAVPATVQLNRVSFESDGQTYVIVTAMPITRAEKIWVLHDPTYKPAPEAMQGPQIGAGPVSKLLQ